MATSWILKTFFKNAHNMVSLANLEGDEKDEDEVLQSKCVRSNRYTR